MAARTNAFIRGFGGLFNWVDVLNRRLFAETAAEAEAEAIRGYWEAVGGYMYHAMGSHSAEYRIYPATRQEGVCQTTANDEKPLPE